MNNEAMDLKEQIRIYGSWLKDARTLYENNKNANLSKIEFVSNQLKHQAIGKIEVLPDIIRNLKVYEKEIQESRVSNNEVTLKALKDMKLGGTQQYALGNDDAIRKVLRLLNDY